MASQQQQLSADQRCGYEPLVGVPTTMSEDLLGEDPDAPSLMIRGNASYCVPESMFEDAGGIPDGCYPLTVVQYQMLRRQEARQLLEKSEQATKRRESSPSAAAAAPDTRAAKMEQMATPRRSLHLDGRASGRRRRALGLQRYQELGRMVWLSCEVWACQTSKS